MALLCNILMTIFPIRQAMAGVNFLTDSDGDVRHFRGLSLSGVW